MENHDTGSRKRRLDKYEVDRKGELKNLDAEEVEGGDYEMEMVPCFSPNGHQIVGYKWGTAKPHSVVPVHHQQHGHHRDEKPSQVYEEVPIFSPDGNQIVGYRWDWADRTAVTTHSAFSPSEEGGFLEVEIEGDSTSVASPIFSSSGIGSPGVLPAKRPRAQTGGTPSLLAAKQELEPKDAWEQSLREHRAAWGKKTQDREAEDKQEEEEGALGNTVDMEEEEVARQHFAAIRRGSAWDMSDANIMRALTGGTSPPPAALTGRRFSRKPSIALSGMWEGKETSPKPGILPKVSEKQMKRVLFSLTAAADCRPHIWLIHQRRTNPARMRIFRSVDQLKKFAEHLATAQQTDYEETHIHPTLIAEAPEQHISKKGSSSSDPLGGMELEATTQTMINQDSFFESGLGNLDPVVKKEASHILPMEKQGGEDGPIRPSPTAATVDLLPRAQTEKSTIYEHPFGKHSDPVILHTAHTQSQILPVKSPAGKKDLPQFEDRMYHRKHSQHHKHRRHHGRHHKHGHGKHNVVSPLSKGTAEFQSATSSGDSSRKRSQSTSSTSSSSSSSSTSSTDSDEINETFWLDVQATDADVIREILALFPVRENTIDNIIHPETLDNIEMFSAENYVTCNVVCKGVPSDLLVNQHEVGTPVHAYRPQHFVTFLREVNRVVCSVVLYEDWIITLHSMPFQGLPEMIRRIQDVYGMKRHKAAVNSGVQLSAASLNEHDRQFQLKGGTISPLNEYGGTQPPSKQTSRVDRRASDMFSVISVFGDQQQQHHRAEGSSPNLLSKQFLTTTWVCATLINFITESILPDPSSLLAEADSADEEALQINADQREILQKIAQLRRSLSNQQSTILRKEKLIISFQTPEMRNCFVAKVKVVSEIYRRTLTQITFVSERLNVAREVLSHANANFASNVSLQMSQDGNEMNKKMQALSQVASVCLPLSIITGAFGMNVTVPYQTNQGYAHTVAPFFIVCSIMVLWLLITSPAIWWSTRKKDEEDASKNVVMGSDLV